MAFLPELIHIAVALGVIAIFALGAVYAERKVSAYIQDRIGPAEVGPMGLFQTVADIIKLVLKENIIPAAADRWMFLLAPIVIFAVVFAGLAVIPMGPTLQGSVLNVGLLYAMAIVSIDIIGLLMAGWGSNNKYAYLGSLRSVAQIIAYEIPAGVTLLAAVMMFGSLDLQSISYQQGIHSPEQVYFLGFWNVTDYGGILSWSIFRYPHLLIGFVVYFIASLAECNRAPFDLPEAESELVTGFHTEYGGARFAFIFLAEYANMLLVSLIATVVFLGGWNSPLPNFGGVEAGMDPAQMTIGQLFGEFQFGHLTTGQPGTWASVLWGAFWVLGKALFLVFVQMWVRWTVPRVRVDQLLRISWKVLTPIAFLLVIISGIWKLLEVYSHL